MTVANSATNNTTQHITTAFIRWQYAVDNQEAGRADVVSNHAQRLILRVFATRQFPGSFQQCLENIDLVVAVHALHNRRNTFKPHAGIHRWFRQWQHLAVGLALELHEDVVPDFNKAVAVFFWRTRRPTPDVLAMVVENLSTWAARTCVTHLPEVIRCVTCTFVITDTHDFILWNAHLFIPDIERFIVFRVNRHHQLVDGQIQPLF